MLAHILHATVQLGAWGNKRGGNRGVKLSLRRRREKNGFSFVLFFSLSYYIFKYQQIELIFPKSSLFNLGKR